MLADEISDTFHQKKKKTAWREPTSKQDSSVARKRLNSWRLHSPPGVAAERTMSSNEVLQLQLIAKINRNQEDSKMLHDTFQNLAAEVEKHSYENIKNNIGTHRNCINQIS